MKAVSILVVDDHPIFAKGITQLLESQAGYSVVGIAQNCADAMRLLREKKPELAIVDLNLGDEDGLALIEEMRAFSGEVKILVLSMHEERYYAERVLKLGALGYVMKDEAINSSLDAIKTVLSGKVWLSETERERVFDFLRSGPGATADGDRFASVSSLSTRQLQIFTMIGKGTGTAEIAAKLSLSPKTVDTHKEHIKLKLHCGTSQSLRELAIQWVNN
jgi:two-component system, NarL family, response regulator NreC